ncbi:MAG: hypothetical protein IT460_06860 [Planctomycetes bacterium]|nr:hypothetical protein [Planctomycetota bacterium]
MSRRTWTLADKQPHEQPITPAEAVALTEELFTQRDLLQAQQRKLATRREDLARVVGLVLETDEHREVEEAKAKLKEAKDRALDCPDVAKAKAALDAAKKRLSTVAVHREAKAIAKDVKQIEQVNWELRRALVERLSGKRVQYVLPEASPAMPAAALPSSPSTVARSA